MNTFRPPYHVDFHSERGEVTIYVTDADGKEVWYADTDAVNQLVEDGFISTRGFVTGRNMRPDVLERSVLDYLREVGVITNVMPESRRYFADEQDSLYDENPRRRNPSDVPDNKLSRAAMRGKRFMEAHRDRPSYQVIVSNIGTVCDTRDRAEAMGCFNEYVDIVSSPRGRASGESVTLMSDGEIIREYQNEFQSHRQGTRESNPTASWVDHYKGSMEKRIDGGVHAKNPMFSGEGHEEGIPRFGRFYDRNGRIAVFGERDNYRIEYPFMDGPVKAVWFEKVNGRPQGAFAIRHNTPEAVRLLVKETEAYDSSTPFYEPRVRRDNPTATEVASWVDHYKGSMEKRIDGVPEKSHYVIAIQTTDNQSAFLRVGKGSKFDTDPAKARVYRNSDKANEAATKVMNWLKKKYPAKAKKIKSIGVQPKK